MRRRRNLFSRIVPSDIEGPGAEPGTTTGGCSLLEYQSRSGTARSGTPVHGQAVARDGVELVSNAKLNRKPVKVTPNCSRDRIVFANSEDQPSSRI